MTCDFGKISEVVLFFLLLLDLFPYLILYPPRTTLEHLLSGYVTSARPNNRSITGVVLLHLLLIPGIAFLLVVPFQAAQTECDVLALTVPAAFFAAIDNQRASGADDTTSGP